jgi:flagellin-like hook-associated protein FlgL
MRISDSFRYTLFQLNVSKVGQQLDDINAKISSQKNINVPSDDPIKFATSIRYDSEQSIGTQFNNSLQRLSTLVGMYDTSFSSVSSQLSQVAQAATDFDSMDSDLKQAAVEQIDSIIEQLVTVGNTKLGNSYIFGGAQADKAPFRLNNDYSVTYMVGQQGEDATKINVDKAQTGQFGISGRQAFYDTTKIAFGSVDNTYTGDIYSNTDSFAYVIDNSNNTIMMNGGASVTLASGVYSGGTLAKEIKNNLGADYSVAFDSATRKFSITNNTGAAVTFNWSQAGATAASTLGFDKIDSIVTAGETEKSDLDTGRKAFLMKITTGGSTTGVLASRATYQYSTDGGVSWSADLAVNAGGADTTADITVDATNNTFYRNGTALTLTNGTYTGSDLATEIETQLNAAQAGHVVSYNAGTRKFTITNSTGSVETLNWSNAGSTAAGILGFDSADSTMSNGTRDVSDYDAGMFIDGSGVANTTNNRIKLLFSTGTTDNLVANDTFQVKDLSVFEMLKNLRDAFESDDTTWVDKNKKYVGNARELTTKNNSIIAFQGTQASTLIENNKTNITKIQAMQANLVNADMSELATEFTSLLNTYQALLATLAKMQSVNVLDYLS